MPQIDYNLTLTEGQEGLVTDLRPNTIISKIAEGVVGFGRALVAGTDATSQVKIPSAAGQVFRGVSVGTWAMERNSLLNAEYIDKSTVSVLRKGEIWVTVKGDVVIDTQVYYYISGANAGLFTSAVTNTAQLLPGAVFTSSALDGELATIELILPLTNQSLLGGEILAVGASNVSGNNHDVTLVGIKLGDIVIVTNGVTTNPAYVISIINSTDKFTVVWNTDPGVGVIFYNVIRPLNTVYI